MSASKSPASPAPSLKWLRNRVALWARRLHLDAWDIEVSFVTRLGGNKAIGAVTTWSDGYTQAQIRFDVDTYNALDTLQTDRMICHELFHLVHAREDEVIAEMVGREKVYKAWVFVNELTCEALASAITKAYSRSKER